MGKTNVFIVLLLLAGLVYAGSPGVCVDNHTEPGNSLRQCLQLTERKALFVVFKSNIGQNMARFSGRWGKDYDRNVLSGIHSMVFCNAWYSYQVSNLDLDMQALCPLHVTLYGRGNETRNVFTRPGYVGEGSEAPSLLLELEEAVATAIEAAIVPPTP